MTLRCAWSLRLHTSQVLHLFCTQLPKTLQMTPYESHCSQRRWSILNLLRPALLSAAPGLLLVSMVVAQGETVEWRIEQVAGLDVAEVRQFLRDLKSGIASTNEKAICDMIEYPLRTTDVSVSNAAACRENFGTILNRKVVAAVSAQSFDELFVNYQGVMIGSGQVWFSGICRDKGCETSDMKIIAVNN